MFVIIDCNNFYVSCERAFQPYLKHLAGCVMSNNDGCAIARSQEFKDLGLKMGTPYFELQDLERSGKIWWRSSNYPLYQDMMHRVTGIIKDTFPDQEIYSIDECFCDLSEYKIQDIEKMCRELRNKILQYTGIPVCLGIAPTKTLAKIANKIAKRKHKDTGVYYINTELRRINALKETEIDDVWGIGPRNAVKLLQVGVRNAYDYTKLAADYIQKTFTIVGLRTWNELNGLSCIPMEYVREKKKGIGTARSFNSPLTDLEPMQEALSTYVANAAVKLRNQKSVCAKMYVFTHTSRFAVRNKLYSAGVEIKLDVPTDNTSELIKAAQRGLGMIYKKGFRYQKVGIDFNDIRSNDAIQTSLFDDKAAIREKLSKATKTLDNLNLKYGRDTVRFSSMGFQKKWNMKQEYLSGKFTTNINDIIRVKAY